MIESLQQFIPGFNRSLRVERRADRLTGDPRAVLLRDLLKRSGILSWVMAHLNDARGMVDVAYEIHECRPVATTFGPCKKPRFSAQCDAAQGTLGGIVGHAEAHVVKECSKGVPAICPVEPVIDRLALTCLVSDSVSWHSS